MVFCGWKGRIFVRYSLKARYVVKFNPLDKSSTEIGPNFGESGAKWASGVRAKNGSICCDAHLTAPIAFLKLM
jgi:hypothetical protein